MVNEKIRQSVPAWDCFRDDAKNFGALWVRMLDLRNTSLSMTERNFYLHFLIGAFHSLEEPLVRPLTLRLVSLPCWAALSVPKREELLKEPRNLKIWKHLQRLTAKGGEGAPTDRDRFFMRDIISDFLLTLSGITEESQGTQSLTCISSYFRVLV